MEQNHRLHLEIECGIKVSFSFRHRYNHTVLPVSVFLQKNGITDAVTINGLLDSKGRNPYFCSKRLEPLLQKGCKIQAAKVNFIV